MTFNITYDKNIKHGVREQTKSGISYREFYLSHSILSVDLLLFALEQINFDIAGLHKIYVLPNNLICLQYTYSLYNQIFLKVSNNEIVFLENKERKDDIEELMMRLLIFISDFSIVADKMMEEEDLFK